jgi:hypothetical protein
VERIADEMILTRSNAILAQLRPSVVRTGSLMKGKKKVKMERNEKENRNRRKERRYMENKC